MKLPAVVTATPPEDARPIRAELFGLERLEQHAKSLAAASPTSETPTHEQSLLPRVRENARVLLAAYRNVVTAVGEKREITLAEEWFLDNFHVVDEQLREIRDHLPRSYYRTLPTIAAGHLAGFPRVYALAWAYMAHTDSRFELETLRGFVAAYQRDQPLAIGELWAVAIHLRMALVENLRRLAEQVTSARQARAAADDVADRLLGLSGHAPEDADGLVHSLEGTVLSGAFAVQLVQRLRDQEASVMPMMAWLERTLSRQGTTPDEMVAQEHQDQGAANATVRNIITSMRWMSAVDWFGFFESVSLVDEVLRAAPIYSAMDFATRDGYRSQIESLSRGSGRSELEIAREALRLAGPGHDPGHYLISSGRRELEQRLDLRFDFGRWFRRLCRSHATAGYVGGVTLLTAAQLVLLWVITGSAGAAPWVLIVLALLELLPASEVAVALVNRLVAAIFPPERLPKLELSDGVPPNLRTLVVVPTLLTTPADVEEQLGRLEVHHLANPRGHVYFGLLTDWTDGTHEHMPGDDALTAALLAGVDRLNERHDGPPGGGPRFLLLHRRRMWNEQEGKWLGWERKRGKLHELNRLLRGATDTTFISIGGRPPTVPSDVRYVITLDADTRLPKGTVYRLVGAIAHPLNRAQVDPERGRVVRGYGILQPRITPSLPTGLGGTAYQWVASAPGGIDPYAAAASDVYQDLFGEGSYTGKGIYDVDAFEAALRDKVPENTLLSHDLFEGLFARAGLLSDVDLFEEFPGNYEVAARRSHRWVRGDWQLLPWVLGRARDAAGRWPRWGISPHGRWKMVDNLRRSLVAPSSFLLAVAAWILPAVPPLLGTGLFVGSVAVPASIFVLDGLIPPRRGISKRSYLQMLASDVVRAVAQTLVAITMLAHQAWLMTDAVVRTLARLYVTKRHLLEWVPAAQAAYGVETGLGASYRNLRASPILALAAGVLLVLFKPTAWLFATPFLVSWLMAPMVAWRMSRPPRVAEAQVITPEETRALRLLARRTWRYFEQFVNVDSHFLPPDNVQEDPERVVARRTSPTNLGLYLLSATVAHDFGWLGRVDLVQRLEDTLDTMTRLERFRGHFYNWYDTGTLGALAPVYVSTVDSGNLAGHLIAVAQTCRELSEQQVFEGEIFGGIRDALQLTIEATGHARSPQRSQTVTGAQLRDAAESMFVLLEDRPRSRPGWIRRLGELQAQAENLLDIARTLAAEAGNDDPAEGLHWATAVLDCVRSHARDIEAAQDQADEGEAPPPAIPVDQRLGALADRAEHLVWEMDFGCLYDGSRNLFSIGYRVADSTLDPSCYDLLASEARLASFVAIAKGDVPPRHWFLLGRAVTPVGRDVALVSWSGSMFEYLMPLLVMRQPAWSLLDLTCRLVVTRQIQYGAERKIPWGVSESAHNVRDVELTYQYSDFGVPGLGLKRGLFEDVVVAPYATALAAMVEPRAALDNFRRLAAAGAGGAYGFFEALDYTPANLPASASVAVVRAYMAHHQGMTLVALGNVAHEELTAKRFHDHPVVQAAELLLQERTPRLVAVARPRGEEVLVAPLVRDLVLPTLRTFESPHDITPRTQLLSNGRYTVMVTAAGSGFSRWRDLAVTRWREDTTRDPWGTFVFVRDTGTGALWSAGFQPVGADADQYNVLYSEDRAKIIQSNSSVTITLEVVVSPEDDAELRRITVTNREPRERDIDITSYAEVVLAPQAADEAHPAFSNLFVQTEFIPASGALLATRRPRSAGEAQMWLAHVATADGESSDHPQYETSRASFLGRGRGVRTPLAVVDGGPLSNTAGTVLDPIVSLRRRLTIPPRGTVRQVFTTLVTSSREEAIRMAEKYRQPATFERESSLAWTRAQVQLHHLRITQDETHLFQRLANRLLYADPTSRAASETLIENRRGASGLWGYGISGDLPIVLVRIERDEERDVVRQLVRAHEYWRLKGLASDLVILNAEQSSYAKNLQGSLDTLVRTHRSVPAPEREGKSGGVFLLRTEMVSPEDQVLLRAAARIVILGQRGTLTEQVVRLTGSRVGPMPANLRPAGESAPTVSAAVPDLELFNGLGGFTPRGDEYVVRLGRGQWTPAPWINVVANETFGFQVSEAGAGYTWSVNSRENKLTPWSNDPVSDQPGEVLYVQDEESGQLWGPTLLPIREEGWPYVIRHGQGYSRFEHTSHAVALTLLQLVPPSDSVKVSRLTLENRSDRKRRLTVTAYAEWVLGVSRSATASHVVTSLDPETGAIFARNPWNGEFSNRIAFADLGGRQSAWTGDRLEFLGRNTTLDHPASLERRATLSGKVGAGLDPCAVLQTTVELEPGAQTDVLFLLGESEDPESARALVERYRTESADALLHDVRRHWSDMLEVVEVETPDPAMNLLLNRWLLYQTLSCRIHARSAFSQSSGAYGFRDQLQDVMALVLAAPELVRDHLLRAAARQFREGDVQHWWHPPTGRGVRTTISDDRLWLPYAVAHYLRTTQDAGVLEEEVPWLEGAALEEGQHEAYFTPTESSDRDTLYEHCARALDRSLDIGRHGLPLMGSGDWNDGMNRVGHEGQGESVWLAWFLLVNLKQFIGLADARGDTQRTERWRHRATSLEAALKEHAWDGAWYRRAFFDDGTPLGSARNDECQIDSIPQSWAVLAESADQSRSRQAMASVKERLVQPDSRLVLLFAPPFDRTSSDPGYIKGYPPGIRENGGQYTHAAIWSVMAFAKLGEGETAFELFGLLNPINQTQRRADLHRYKGEPYAVAADVYSRPPHQGRAGWTWYTGAAGWLYRAGLESILGFRKHGDTLVLDPCIPRTWPRFGLTYRHQRSLYRIDVQNPAGVCQGVDRISLDGVPVPGGAPVPLSDDGLEHEIVVTLGSRGDGTDEPAATQMPEEP